MKYLKSLFLVAFAIAPQLVFGASDKPTGLVSCQKGGDCDFCDFTTMVNTINVWLLVITTLIGVIIVIYAGFKITSARGEVGVVTEGRKLIGNVAIGIFIVVLAVAIIDIILKTATGGGYGFWNKPAECGKQNDTSGLYEEKINIGVYKGLTPTEARNAARDADYFDFEDGPTVVDPASSGSSRGGLESSKRVRDNNGFGNDPLGEYGDGTAGNPNTGFVNDNGFIDAPPPQ